MWKCHTAHALCKKTDLAFFVCCWLKMFNFLLIYSLPHFLVTGVFSLFYRKPRETAYQNQILVNSKPVHYHHKHKPKHKKRHKHHKRRPDPFKKNLSDIFEEEDHHQVHDYKANFLKISTDRKFAVLDKHSEPGNVLKERFKVRVCVGLRESYTLSLRQP